VIAFAFMPRAPKTFGDKCVDAIRENIHKTGLPWARHDGPMVKDIIDREYAKLHPAKDCSDEEWLASLEANPAYQGLDVRREYEKCRVWTQTNKRQMPTKRRFLNWLNKAERPMVPQSSGNGFLRRNGADPYTEPSFDWRRAIATKYPRETYPDREAWEEADTWLQVPLSIRQEMLK